MTSTDIRAGRLSQDELAENFSDHHPPLSPAYAKVESDRCYFCYDAPCIEACPTAIDIPNFIRKISTGNLKGSAKDILTQNIMGGMCARVCPTEILCEGVCVRNTKEEKPVRIGDLQRYATDWFFESGETLFERGEPTGKRIAIVGGGPAGLSCAHRLALLGHEIVIFEAREKLSGLNEYGIAAYKTVNNFAQREVEFIMDIGGIEARTNHVLGRDIKLDDLRNEFDAVFLSIGLGDVNELGSEDVYLVYRRGSQHMRATWKEQEFAKSCGVNIKYWLSPKSLNSENGHVSGVEFECTKLNSDGKLSFTGESRFMEADIVFKAIGQSMQDTIFLDSETPEMKKGKIAVNNAFETSLEGLWSGGDCVKSGEDLTVQAVEDGKQAANSIHQKIMQG